MVTNDQKSLHIQPIMLVVLQAPYCAQNSASILWKGLAATYRALLNAVIRLPGKQRIAEDIICKFIVDNVVTP